jgi:hypothetical protein
VTDDLWKWATAALGVVTAALGAAWGHIHARINRTDARAQGRLDRLEGKIEAGFKKSGEDRARLYDKIDEQRRETKADLQRVEDRVLDAINGGSRK